MNNNIDEYKQKIDDLLSIVECQLNSHVINQIRENLNLICLNINKDNIIENKNNINHNNDVKKIDLQSRDLSLLRLLGKNVFLKSTFITKEIYNNSQYGVRRLKKLKDCNIIIKYSGLLFLTKKGYKICKENNINVITFRQFINENKALLECEYCVYVLKDISNNIFYIGQSTNLESRIRSHATNEIYGNKINVISYAKCKNKIEMALAEMVLIDKHKPKFNKQYVTNSKIRNNALPPGLSFVNIHIKNLNKHFVHSDIMKALNNKNYILNAIKP